MAGHNNKLAAHTFWQKLLPVGTRHITFETCLLIVFSEGIVAAIGQKPERRPIRRARWREKLAGLSFKALALLVLGAGLGVFVAERRLVPLVVGPIPWAGVTQLETVEKDVAQRWPQISHLSRGNMSGMLATQRAEVVVFDVREPGEFAVSHLPGAIRIDPGLSREQFLAEHAASLQGKSAVFYCSVGVRSSLLASRMQADLERGGVQHVYNLTGGIFGWHNDARPLVTASGATDSVHGYDAWWGRLVTRQSLVKSAP